ncbi:site-specific integrase [Sphingobacterium sp. BIGb0116]|uniref:site-specific integrase n=1 Tax=Sphingobacterium sp. BIGb0116 TaxID=2940619 RepID=UPI002168693C|nr:site-specific integrase [Sphingobacterium sp. BIGb0116]MCS4165140.1 site-specific recombinase XerD [Sphingobacterium sp. BIGb0116]
MLEKSFGLLFFLKKTKFSKGTERLLYGRITINGISKEFSTKRNWYKDRWNQGANRATGNKEDAKSINHYLDALVSKIYEVKRELIANGEDVTTENLFDLLFGNTDDRKFILQIFQAENAKMKALEGKGYAIGTIKRFETSLSHTREFIQWKYNCNDIEIRKLDYEFVKEYDFWLKTVRNCSQNTASKYIGNFKKIVLHCIKSGWLRKDPFHQFKLLRKEVIKEFLTEHELESLMKKIFSIKRLEIVRDIFAFSCFTGLAYTDVNKLIHSQFFIGVDGKKWISYKRTKTLSLTKVPLLNPAIQLIEKYTIEAFTLDDKVFPCFSNQKMNAYLKEIADLCGINKILTFHMARHTFATTVTLTNRVPLETVSKMMGHKSLKQTQHYAKIVDVKISDDMKRLRQKFI